MPWYVYTTFTQNFYMGMKQTYGVFCSPCWSLAVEEQFYLTLPFLVRFVPRRWIGAVIGVLLVACVSARSYLYITGGINSVQFITLPFCRADGLLIGVSCALLVRNDRVRQYLVRTPAVLYGLAVLFGGASFYMLAGKWRAQDRADMTTDFTLWALFFASILLISVLHPGSPVCKPLRFKPLMKLGTIAYCLYLIHDSVRDVTVAVANRNGDPGLGVTWISIGVGITISIALASLSWVAYEKWFIRIGRRFNYAAPQTARHNATLVALVPEEASVPQQMS
jgi:peptidoglycan/LPS O-acetylase OafA/YrhL